MALPNEKKLDNPVWYSLDEAHREYSLDYNNLKCYHPDYCPFGGYQDSKSIANSVDQYAKLADNFYLVGEKPAVSPHLGLKKELVCLQMVIGQRIDNTLAEQILSLNADRARELFDLVNLVQPGYFRNKTRLLGNYYGIFKTGTLVAVTGERMKMNDFTEVSAVVTHPDHTGRGYAKQLITYAVNKIFDENKFPYLHVAETNNSAIKLYEKLGFTARRKISFWNFERTTAI